MLELYLPYNQTKISIKTFVLLKLQLSVELCTILKIQVKIILL